MTIQFDVTTRNARADATETSIGTSPTLYIRTGAPPASCAAADSGTELEAIVLPADWLAAASSGVKSMLGTWSDTFIASGTEGHFRIKDSGGTCRMQGTVGTSGTDMIASTGTATSGGTGAVTSFSLTEANA